MIADSAFLVRLNTFLRENFFFLFCFFSFGITNGITGVDEGFLKCPYSFVSMFFFSSEIIFWGRSDPVSSSDVLSINQDCPDRKF